MNTPREGECQETQIIGGNTEINKREGDYPKCAKEEGNTDLKVLRTPSRKRGRPEMENRATNNQDIIQTDGATARTKVYQTRILSSNLVVHGFIIPGVVSLHNQYKLLNLNILLYNILT